MDQFAFKNCKVEKLDSAKHTKIYFLVFESAQPVINVK
jgi:hypothetical protein